MSTWDHSINTVTADQLHPPYEKIDFDQWIFLHL